MAGDEESCCGSGVGGGTGRTKPNILVTGTPGTGKTTTSSLLADATQLRYINVGDLIKNNNLHDGWDEEFECHIINEELMSILDKKKVIWDEEMLETCIRLCVKEVMKGNRPTTHLNKEGCVNVIAKFKNLTQKDLGNKQLKVKWDNLKKDWKLWKKLIGKETSLGWNSEKKTIEASDDWWIAKLKEVPAAIKFREKGLFMPYELEILFGNVIASREHAWTSASRSLPLRDIPVTNIEGYGDSDDILNQTP